MRRKAREAALQLLYQIEFSGQDPEGACTLFWAERPAVDGEVREFAERLVREVRAAKEEIDRLIDSAASNWQLDRIARLDLSLLRLAVCELLCFPEVPAQVVVNEAVDIARKYSDTESPAFINGVLDRIARERGLFEEA